MIISTTVIKRRFNSLFRAAILFICVFSLMELAEYVIAGRIVGSGVLASMTMVSPLLTFLTFVSIMITSGTVTLYSYDVGNSDRDNANSRYSQGVILALGSGLLLSLLLYFFRDFLFLGWEVDANLLREAQAYYNGIILRPAFYFLDYLLMGLLMVEGESKLCVKAAVVQLVLNIILGVIWCDDWEIEGLSSATTVSIAISTLIKASYLWRANCPLQFHCDLSRWSIKTVFGYSLFSALQPLMQMLMIISANNFILDNFNEETLVIYSVVLRIWGLGTSISDTITEAIQPMVCLYHAEDNLVGIKKIMRYGLQKGLVALGLLTVLTLLVSPSIPHFFGIDDLVASRETTLAVCLCLTGLPVFLFVHLLTYYYIYTNRRRYAAILQPALLFVGPLSGIVVLSSVWGKIGLWLGATFGVLFALTVLLLLVKFVSGRGQEAGILLLNREKVQRQKSYDFLSSTLSVVNASQQVQQDLEAEHIPRDKVNKIILAVEEWGLAAADAKSKPVPVEVTVCLENGSVRLIVRHDGISKDFSDNNDIPYSFRQYFIAQMVEVLDKESYLLLGKENRTILRI